MSRLSIISGKLKSFLVMKKSVGKEHEGSFVNGFK